MTNPPAAEVEKALERVASVLKFPPDNLEATYCIPDGDGKFYTLPRDANFIAAALRAAQEKNAGLEAERDAACAAYLDKGRAQEAARADAAEMRVREATEALGEMLQYADHPAHPDSLVGMARDAARIEKARKVYAALAPAPGEAG